KTAVGYRRRIVENSDAFRVVFSEGDGLPGLIVDCYNDVLSTQVLTQAMDHAELRDIILRTLLEEFKPAAVVERVEPRIRELEQLPPLDQGLRFGDKTRTIFTMNGVRFHFSALEGQKTGAFLDQRENYAAAASYARGEALDVFCYHGGFALHLARVCSQVTAVDSSRPALEIAEQNEKLNPRDGPEIEWMEANAFDLLKDYSMAGRQYDTIVLDPPAFAKSRKALETAMRGYKELNLRALKMLRPGGVLVTCSCSFHVGEDDFLEMLRAAAFDARQSPKVIAKRGQSRDHPVLLAVPETAYLKCVILTV
ncbi:MAG TPA: class I SAM-dependent rRNA methyltransferase, partial [Burkholderiaceae bacterium]|nr:class I SAM-dependent rRNA methyltransferase [Burkholderiaceae bacterium]